MTDTALVQVYAEVAVEHARQLELVASSVAPVAPLIVPVLIDRFEVRSELIEELTLALDGVLLDTNDARFEKPVLGRVAPELMAEVVTKLDRPTIRGRRTVSVFSHPDGTVDVGLALDGTAVPAASISERRLTALVRALFSAELADHRLVVLSFRDDGFDPDERKGVLSLLTGLGTSGGMRVGQAVTLVVLVYGATFSTSMHVRPNGGARFVIERQHLTRRTSGARLFDAAVRLGNARMSPLVLYLGAGFSVSSGLPSGNALRDRAIRSLRGLHDVEDGRTSQDLALSFCQWAWAESSAEPLISERERDLGSPEAMAFELTLEQVARIEAAHRNVAVPEAVRLFSELHADRISDGRPFGPAVIKLAQLAARGPRLVVVTVNFDELLEHAAPDAFQPVVSNEDFAEIEPVLRGMVEGNPPEKVPLLKLHGTISDLGSCITAAHMTEHGLATEKAIALRALGRPGGDPVWWAYIGASMRDLDVLPVLRERQIKDAVEEWWVGPRFEASVLRFVKNRRRGPSERPIDGDQVLLTTTADDFVADLVDSWQWPPPA